MFIIVKLNYLLNIPVDFLFYKSNDLQPNVFVKLVVTDFPNQL